MRPAANKETARDAIRGKAIEIEMVIDPGTAREVGLYVLRSPDGAERTRISLFPKDNRRFGIGSLQIDISEASLRTDVFARTPEIGPLKLEDVEMLRLRIFVDRSIVEVFANGYQCLTLRVYPEREDSTGVPVFARGGAAKLMSLNVWQMRSVWPGLLPPAGSSKANLASGRGSAGPADREFQSWQDFFTPLYESIYRYVMVAGAAAGSLKADAGEMAEMKISTVWPTIEVRDDKQHAEANAIRKLSGVLSGRTWTEEDGRDWEVERERLRIELEDAIEFTAPGEE